MADSPTYAWHEDNLVYAVLNGRVIAKGEDPDAVKEDAEKTLKREEEKAKEDAAKKRVDSATHVVTPSGVKGQIVSRVSSWDSDQSVSVRFENGRIVTISTSKLPLESFVTEDTQKTAGVETPITTLRSRLDAEYEHDKDSLARRAEELGEIKREASTLAAEGASYTDEQELDEIVVFAETEQSEVKEALEHLNDADAELFTAPEYQAVEQAAVGVHGDGTWLDHTVNEMRTEAEGQDFQAILDEGPVTFTAELPDAALADAGVTASAARDFIETKTAGVESEELEKYRAVFVERVEDARRTELAERKSSAKREASIEQPSPPEGPDDILFI